MLIHLTSALKFPISSPHELVTHVHMKTWFLWLLVPFAAWLGYRGGGADPHPVESPATAPSSQTASTSEWLWPEASKIAESDFDSLLRQVIEFYDEANTDRSYFTLRLLCARLAEIDPAAALDWLATQDPHLTWTPNTLILTEWALRDSDAAWRRIPEGSDGDMLRQMVTRALLHEDREIFMQWFRRVRRPMPTEPDPVWILLAGRHGAELEEIARDHLSQAENPSQTSRYAPMFQLLAMHRATIDPVAALEWASGLDSSVRHRALQGALEVWGKTDPVAAWERAITQDGSRSAASLLLTKLAKQDPAAALGLVTDLDRSQQVHRSGGVDAMLATLGPAVRSGEMDPIEAFRLLDSAKGDASFIPLNVLPNMWFGVPPDRLATAAHEILAESPSRNRALALGGIASAWMISDPNAALAFISEIEDPELRHRTYGGMFYRRGVSLAGPRQIEILRQIPAADRAGAYTSWITRHGAGLTAGRARSLERKIQPERIASVIEDLPASAEFRRAAGVHAMIWSESDPAGALAWARDLPDAEARRAAYAGAIDGWAFYDPFTAAAWLADEPPGPERDAAAVPLVRRVAPSDPEGAWEWAAFVQDPALQSEARLEVLKEWSTQAPAEALAALQEYTATLPPAAAAEFIQRHASE